MLLEPLVATTTICCLCLFNYYKVENLLAKKRRRFFLCVVVLKRRNFAGAIEIQTWLMAGGKRVAWLLDMMMWKRWIEMVLSWLVVYSFL
jgi:hypothetical protein